MTFVSSEFCWPVRWDSSRSPRGEVSSLFDPAKRSAAGGWTDLNLRGPFHALSERPHRGLTAQLREERSDALGSL